MDEVFRSFVWRCEHARALRTKDNIHWLHLRFDSRHARTLSEMIAAAIVDDHSRFGAADAGTVDASSSNAFGGYRFTAFTIAVSSSDLYNATSCDLCDQLRVLVRSAASVAAAGAGVTTANATEPPLGYCFAAVLLSPISQMRITALTTVGSDSPLLRSTVKGLWKTAVEASKAGCQFEDLVRVVDDICRGMVIELLGEVLPLRSFTQMRNLVSKPSNPFSADFRLSTPMCGCTLSIHDQGDTKTTVGLARTSDVLDLRAFTVVQNNKHSIVPWHGIRQRPDDSIIISFDDDEQAGKRRRTEVFK
jgi:hypothetical protein